MFHLKLTALLLMIYKDYTRTKDTYLKCLLGRCMELCLDLLSNSSFKFRTYGLIQLIHNLFPENFLKRKN